MREYVLLAAAGVVGLALLTAGVYIGQWWEGGDSTVRLTHQSDLIQSPDDLQSTAPAAIRYGDAPGSTRADCIEVPTWLDSLRGLSRSTPEGSRPQIRRSDTQKDPRARSLERSGKIDGLPYVITPMTNGHPSLSVGSDVATLQAFDPRSGRPLEFDYDIRKDWALWPELSARALPSGLQASAQAALRYRGLTVTAGYAATSEGRGWTAGVRWRLHTFRW